MNHPLILATLLALFWLALSGHYSPFILMLGVLSIMLIVWLNQKMGISDKKILPPALLKKQPRYWCWLLVEIVKSNFHVVKKIWQFKLDIEPQFTKVASPFRTDMVKVIQANSITLTPGTVTVSVGKNELLVHALTKESLKALDSPEMQKQLEALEKDL